MDFVWLPFTLTPGKLYQLTPRPLYPVWYLVDSQVQYIINNILGGGILSASPIYPMLFFGKVLVDVSRQDPNRKEYFLFLHETRIRCVNDVNILSVKPYEISK
jgi:hypothetical protein